MNRKIRAIVTILLVIFALIGVLFINYAKKTKEIDKTSKYLIIGKETMVAVYEDKLAINIPDEINFDKDRTFKDLKKIKSDEEILEAVNKILPEKIEKSVRMKFGKLNLDVKNTKNIPEINIDNKRYILTSSLYSMFNTLYTEQDNKNELNESIIVDILNANGKNGYAKRTGENIKNKLGMRYNAANYETNMEQSYIVLNDISVAKAEEIVGELSEKYFKIQKSTTVPTLANVVVILGKEENIDTTIYILGDGEITKKEAMEKLKQKGYQKIEFDKSSVKTEGSVIEYSSEDYFIAYKIAKLLNIPNMLEKDGITNKIRVICN